MWKKSSLRCGQSPRTSQATRPWTGISAAQAAEASIEKGVPEIQAEREENHYAGDKAAEDLKILEPALVNIPRVHEYLSGIFYTPETRGSNLEEITRGLAAQVTEMHSDAVIQVFGSFLTETWVEASSIDVSINSSSIKDTYSFIVALKSKLVQSTEVEVVRSKSLPMIRYRVLDGDRWVNVTINNATAGNTEVVAKYCKLNRKVGELIRVVKLWARSVQLIGTWQGISLGGMSGV